MGTIEANKFTFDPDTHSALPWDAYTCNMCSWDGMFHAINTRI